MKNTSSGWHQPGEDPRWEKTGSEPGYYKIPAKEVIGYGSVDFAMNLVFQAIMMYITFFYTDIFGLRPGHVAVMFLVSRLWDTINDPIMGWVVERFNPRHGKYRSWVMYGAIPFGIAAVLTYTTPEMSYGLKLLWAYVTYNVLNMLYTLIIQPYASMATVMTNDQRQRTRLQSVRMMLAQSGGVVVALTIPLLSEFLANHFSLQRSYQLTTAAMAIVMVVILLWACSTVHERIKATSHEEPVGFTEIFRQARLNRPGFILFLLFFGVYGFNTIQSSTGVYYMTYVAERADMVPWFSMMNVLPSVIGVPFVPFLVSKLNKKGTVILGLAIGGLGALLLGFAPTDAVALMMICRGISSFGYGILMGILWSIITDAIEYGDLFTGRRLAAIVLTLVGLGLKFSMLIGGVLPTWILEMINYIPNQPQTQEAMNGIHAMSTWLPAGIMLVTIIIFAAFYDLNEERVAEIQHLIAIRDGLVPDDRTPEQITETEPLYQLAEEMNSKPQRFSDEDPSRLNDD